MQPVKNQPRLDRLPEPDLVGEQRSRRQPRHNLPRNVHLMRNEVDASPNKTADRRTKNLCPPPERFVPQLKQMTFIGLSRQQPRFWRAEADVDWSCERCAWRVRE